MRKGQSYRLLAAAAALLMVTSLWGGLIGAQIVPPVPFNEATGECVHFNQSPLSLTEVYVEGATRHDLDLDGHTNSAEFLQLSDPTDSKSTPTDRDGDGVDRVDDECDFDPTRPQQIIVKFVTELPEEANRGESFNVIVSVTDRNDSAVSGASVKLLVDMSGGFSKNVTMTPTATAGQYNATLAMKLGDAANPGDPWVVSAEASKDGKVGRIQPGSTTQEDKRQYVTVNPIEFPIDMDTYLCTQPADLSTCKQKSAFFQDQEITVIAKPNMTKFFKTSSGAPDRSAVLRYASQVTVDGVQVAEGPEFQEPMTEVNLGGQLVYHATINPAATHLPPPGDHDVAGVFEQTEFRLTAYIEDDAGMSQTSDPLERESSLPNTGEETVTAPVDFGAAEERIFTHVPDEPTPRTHTLPIKVEYQRSGETTTGPSATATAKIYETSTSAVPIATVTLVEGIENGQGNGVYTGGYPIQIEDPMTQRPDMLSPDLDFDFKWFVDVEIAGTDVKVDNAKFPVSPTTVESEVIEPPANANYTARITDQGDLEVDEIPVVFTLTGNEGEDFHNDPAQHGCAAGVATATLYHRSDSEQLVEIDSILLVDGVGNDPQNLVCDDTYEGSFDWPEIEDRITAFALAGDWVVVVSFEDEAVVPNTAEHEIPIVMVRDVVGFQGATVVKEDPSVKIDDVFGFNNAEWDPEAGEFVGITGDNATDKDPILGIDDRTKHRFVGVEGTATGLRLQILLDDGSGTTLSIPPNGPVERELTGVFVQFDDRQLQLEVVEDREGLVAPYYGRAILDDAPNATGVWNWRVMFDTQGASEELHPDEDQWENQLNANDEPLTGYDWPPMRDDEFTGVKAYAYTGPIVYETFRHQRTCVVVCVTADIEPIRVTPQAHVPNDVGGTYSSVAEYSFDFDFQGASKVRPAGVEIPLEGGGSQIVLGGGPLLYSDASDDPITLVAPWADANGNEVVETLVYFAKVERRNCDGSSGSEWCEEEAYTLAGGEGAYVPMTPVASEKQFKLDITGPLKQDDTVDIWGDDGGDEDERYWAKIRVRNNLGYTTGPTGPHVWHVDGESSSGPSPGDDFTPYQGNVPGHESTQFTFVEPTVTITKVTGLSGARPDFRTAGTPFVWTPESGPHASLPDVFQERGVQAFVASDELTVTAQIDLNLPKGPGGAPMDVAGLTIDPASAQANNWDLLQRICCDSNGNLITRSNSDSVNIAYLGGAPSGDSDTFEFKVFFNQASLGLEEQVGVFGDPFTEFQVETYNSLGVRGTTELRFALDRNAPPGVDFLRILMDDQDGVNHTQQTILSSSFNNTNPPVVRGIADLVFEGVDLDGQNFDGSHSDVRATEEFQLAFSHLMQGPDAQFQAGDEGGADVDNPPQRVEFPVAIPRVCVFLCVGQYDGFEMFVPLRVGMDPLFLKMHDPANPTSWEPRAGDTVFGFDTGGGENGYARLYGPDGTIGVQPSVYDLAAVHALELNLDDGQGRPYIGLRAVGSSNQGNAWDIAVGFDRGFDAESPTDWRATEDPRDTTPDQWGIVQCTIIQAQTGDGWLDDPETCPFLEEYEWVGIANAFTPMTIYSEGSPAVNLWGGNCRVDPAGDDYPREGPGTRCDDNYDTSQDFPGVQDGSQDALFMIPRGFFWELLTDSQFISEDAEGGEFNRTLNTLVPYEDLRLPAPSANNVVNLDDDELDDAGADMLLPDGRYIVTGRGIDGVEVISEDEGGRNDDGPLYDFEFIVENDFDDDGYSDPLEHKLRDQIRNGTHRDFERQGGYRGSDSALNPNGLPLAEGWVNFTHPVAGLQNVTADMSTPCDWDGDGVPNDYNCLGQIDLEAQFNMNPFVWDTPMDDPNQNGIPNFMDPFQQYRFDCVDSDQDGWCNTEEEAAGSDPNNPRSVPGDADGDRIPDDLEENLGPALDTDGDGWENQREIILRTNPLDPCSYPGSGHQITAADHDGDGWPTVTEVSAGTDPLDACDHP